MVTPRLAKPVAPGSVTLPTDKFVEPTDAEFYWQGKIEGTRARRRPPNELNEDTHMTIRITLMFARRGGPRRLRRTRQTGDRGGLRQLGGVDDQGADRGPGGILEPEHGAGDRRRPGLRGQRHRGDARERVEARRSQAAASQSGWAAREGPDHERSSVDVSAASSP